MCALRNIPRKLLFGPYRTPRFRYGSVVFCEVRGEVRITTTLVDIDPADIAIGLRVAPVFDHGADGVTLLRYRPVG